MPPEGEERLDVQVFDEIRSIEHLARAKISGLLPVGLSYPQWEVLNLLARRADGASPGEIAQALQAPGGGVASTLQRLWARKLVEVEHCPAEGGRKRVWLTPGGRAAYAQAMAGLQPKIEMLREGFTEKEFRDALPFLRALRAWLSEKDPLPA